MGLLFLGFWSKIDWIGLVFLNPLLFRQLDHHVRNLHIFLGLVFGRHLEDDVLLVIGDRLLADVLDELAHPVEWR